MCVEKSQFASMLDSSKKCLSTKSVDEEVWKKLVVEQNQIGLDDSVIEILVLKINFTQDDFQLYKIIFCTLNSKLPVSVNFQQALVVPVKLATHVHQLDMLNKSCRVDPYEFTKLRPNDKLIFLNNFLKIP